MSGPVLLPGHNHDKHKTPTYPTFRAACPQGCDELRVTNTHRCSVAGCQTCGNAYPAARDERP